MLQIGLLGMDVAALRVNIFWVEQGLTQECRHGIYVDPVSDVTWYDGNG